MGEYTDMLTEGMTEGPAPAPPTSYTDMLTEEGALGEIPDVKDPTDPIERAVLADQRAGVPGAVRNFTRLLTGVLREEDLPSFVDYTALKPDQKIKIALAYALNIDDQPVADVIKKQVPGAKISQDKYGNHIVDIEGKRFYLNQPGLSKEDAARFIAQIAQFAPAAKAGSLATGTLGRAGIVGAGSAATSVAQDVASGALGSEQGIDPAKAAGAAAGGAAFEILAPLVGRVFSYATGRKFALGDGSLTPEGEKFVKELGIDPDLVTPELAKKLNNLSRRVETRFASEANQTTAAQAGARSIESGEFGIPLTQGEAAANLRQIAKEEAMRAGARGEGAQKTMEAFDTRRSQAIQGAADSVQGGVAGAATRTIDDPVEAAAGLTEGIRQAEATAGRAVDDAYAAARELNASISGENMQGFRTYVVSRMRQGGGGLDTQFGTTRKTQAALKLFRNVTSIKDGKLRGTDLKRMEKFRRYLNSQLDGADGLDKKNLTLMKQGLDEWLDAAIDKSLFEGSEKALEVLKEARQKRFNYGELFERGPKDVQNVVRKIIHEDATATEVANWMFGNVQIGTTGRSVRLVDKVQAMFGDTSREWAFLREGAFMRMLYGKATPEGVAGQTIGRQALANNIRKALGPESREFMTRMFTPAEIKQFVRLEKALRNTIPPQKATNPSGSGFEVGRLMEDMFGKFVTMGTMMTGGPVAAAGAHVSQGAIRALTRQRAAQAATKNIKLPSYRAPRFTSLGAASGATATQ